MTGAEFIVHQLLETADPNKGLLGVEIELLIRKDLDGVEKVGEVFRELGFSVDSDPTVYPRKDSLEQYYASLETSNEEPAKWSDLKPRLTKLLSWLKREDVVHVKPVPDKWTSSVILSEPLSGSKSIKLARGRVASEFTGGTHLHFDAKTWFDTPEHAQNFVKFFNGWRKWITTMVPRGRYGIPDVGGETYAPPKEIKTPMEPPSEWNHPPKTAKELLDVYSKYNPVKYSALNFTRVRYDGDLEFRFMHATLNIGTIEGWIQLLADFIELSKEDANADWSARLARESPGSDEFVRKQASRSSRSEIPTEIQKKQPRATRRLLHRSVPKDKAKQAVRQLVGPSLYDEPEHVNYGTEAGIGA